MITHHCTPQRPCNRWRTCDYCARKRQARIASAAEAMYRLHGQLAWHILYPRDRGQQALRDVRSHWLQAAKPASALWTVEASSTGALHLNLLTPADTQHPPRVQAEHWVRIVNDTSADVRNVGAYIAKRRQMPSQHAYAGRLWGTWGHVWQILATQTQKHYPLVSAAALQLILDRYDPAPDADCLARRALAAGIVTPPPPAAAPSPQPERSWDEYRAIAAKYLPDLLERLGRAPSSRAK